MDMSTGAMVEEGMAVGIIAAQSIGEPGTQLTMRTFHIGGAVNTSVEDSEIRTKKAGIVKFAKMRTVTNSEGSDIVLTRNSQIVLLDKKGRELEKYDVPTAAFLRVKENDEVTAGQVLCQWNPHKIPIVSEVSGKVRLDDVVEGQTMRLERNPGGSMQMIIIDHKGDLHPQIVIEDADGKPQDVYYLPERAVVTVAEGAVIAAGSELAEMNRESKGVADITGGLPRVTEIFEARKPRDPAVIAEVDGVVELLQTKRRGKRTIVIRSESGVEHEHLVPHGKRFLVHTGDHVKAGHALVDGPLVPHDILRVSGEEAVQQYLTHEIQQVYRSQRVEINDKHVEVIIARMLRKVRIDSSGDTNLLPGLVMDKFEFRRVNDEVSSCVKISDPGDTDFAVGAIIRREVLDQTNGPIEAMGGTQAKGKKPKQASASTQLLGITKAAVQSSSFISAASFQETTKVLTEAALAGKTDRLVGLKENVILGHLIPAGTGFRSFQESEISYRREALEDLLNRGETAMQDNFPLLEQSPVSDDQQQSGKASQHSGGSEARSFPTSLDQLLGSSEEAGDSVP
jgi:DNA-directed RNA polymerase subunit beta'